MNTVKRSITFDRAHWRIPSVETAFDGYLEGGPTEVEKKETIENILLERKNWEPSQDAWTQFSEVKETVGQEVEVQMWDPIMFMLDDEGPYPILAHYTGLDLVANEEGKQQAYLLLHNVRCLETPMGYDGRSRLKAGNQAGEFLLPLADIYTVSWAEINVSSLPGGSTNYRESICKHLADYKEKVLGIMEDGIFMYRGAKKLKPHILLKNVQDRNILPEYRKLFFNSEYSNIKRHMYFHHLNSSQAMCINLFYPLISEEKLSQITEYLGINAGTDLIAQFEKESELEDAARRTNFDFYLKCSAPNCSEIFFEVKFTENGFGKAKPDDEHKKKFKETYLPLVERSKYLNENCRNESFFLGHYQLLRNLVHIDYSSYVVFLFPSANHKAKKEVEEMYQHILNDLGRSMVRVVFLEELIAWLETKNKSGSLSQHYSSFRGKYLL